jgi:TRAP transporter TAXI family solute receptor
MKRIGTRSLISAILISFLSLSEVALAERAGWPAAITIGTASPGGPYYVYGQAIARVLSRVLGIETNAQVTQGPAQNIVLLEKREATLGFITTGVGLQGWNGINWAKGTKYRSIRVVFPMYDTAFQFATPKRLGIKSLKGLGGLRIGAGPRAGTGGTYVPEIFNALSIPAIVRFGAIDQQTTQAVNGELDGVAFGTGFPVPALLLAASGMDFLQPSSEEVGIIRKQMPELSPSLVPVGTYSSLTEDYRTIGLYNFAVAHKDLPDDFIYDIVKVVFDKHEELVKAHPAANETVPANIVRNISLPVHPGAARYYREIGIAIPTTAVDQNN